MKIAIVGARKWTNKLKIKDFIFELRRRYGDDVTIVSGGCKDGADKYAKKYALEFGLPYIEYPPYHHPYNLHCVLPKRYYGKPYHVRYFFVRNKQIAENSDMTVGFVPVGHISNGTNSTLKYAKKAGKKTLIIS